MVRREPASSPARRLDRTTMQAAAKTSHFQHRERGAVSALAVAQLDPRRWPVEHFVKWGQAVILRIKSFFGTNRTERGHVAQI